MSPGLHTTVAETLVPGDPPATFAAAGRLVDRLWPGRTETVAVEPPGLLVHGVAGDAWLTWEIAPSGSDGWTRVRLVCDEADTSPGPPPGLDAVLALLLEEVGAPTLRRPP